MGRDFVAGHPITDYHAKLFAYQLSQRVQGDQPNRLTSSIMDSSVDLNPHQIDAALFAFQSPLSNGVILADEVGLGKTIEAGLVISQLWAERSRRVIVITPSSLRKQWEAELRDKFHLPVKIMDGPAFRAEQNGNPRRNPFDRNGEEIVICSLQFAARNAEFIERIPWDLVVIDEAHRLRTSTGKQHKAIKESLTGRKKLLLTATPLQNRLEELWSLSTLIDEHHFGERRAFNKRYSQPMSDEDFSNLQSRLQPLVKRTLRKDAREFIKFTNRFPMVEPFTPSDDELSLYDDLTDFLRRPNLQALPSSQRHLITMVMHKLLASSTYAIAGALRTMANRLKRDLHDLPPSRLDDVFGEDVDELTSTIDEWGVSATDVPAPLDGDARITLQQEIAEIERFADRAERITHNAKVDALKIGLRKAFAETQRLGGERKALIFTESRKTQEYLSRVLSNDPEFAQGIMLFNGSNSDRTSREIYDQWKQRHVGSDRVTGTRDVDIRAALVDYFRDSANIMIATEAAAEGINLQFCSLVINYDLPWNPQRIEQRIGRCHRYGQKSDVVVLNFVNTENAADERVFELLNEKFHLFSGVFGSSDEVLGSIGSGADFEKRVAEIYRDARSTADITKSFNQLQLDFFDRIEEAKESTERKLFQFFDQNVAERFQTRRSDLNTALDMNERLFMDVTRHELAGKAEFEDARTFVLNGSHPGDDAIPRGRYQLATRKKSEYPEGHLYRIGHPLAQRVLASARARELPGADLFMDYGSYPARLSSIEKYRGYSGWVSVNLLKIEMETGDEDHILLAGVDQTGKALDADQIRDLFRLPATRMGEIEFHPEVLARLKDLLDDAKAETMAGFESRVTAWIEQEQAKLDEWSRDRRQNLVGDIDKIDRQIETLRRENRVRGGNIREQQERRKQIASLTRQRDDLEDRNRVRRREIEREQEQLLDRAWDRIHHNSTETQLFTIRWTMR